MIERFAKVQVNGTLTIDAGMNPLLFRADGSRVDERVDVAIERCLVNNGVSLKGTHHVTITIGKNDV